MRLTQALALALTALAAAGSVACLPLLDPSDVVGELSAPGQGVEGALAKRKKPDFCGCAAEGGRGRQRCSGVVGPRGSREATERAASLCSL